MHVLLAEFTLCGFVQLRIALSDSILAIKEAGGNAVYLNLCGPACDGCGGHPGQR